MKNIERKIGGQNNPDKKNGWLYYCKGCGHTEIAEVYDKYRKCVICGNNYKMPRKPE